MVKVGSFNPPETTIQTQYVTSAPAPGSECVSFDSIPTELVWEILLKLDFSVLFPFSLTHRRIQNITDSENFWKLFVKQHYPTHFSSTAPSQSGAQWKRIAQMIRFKQQKVFDTSAIQTLEAICKHSFSPVLSFTHGNSFEHQVMNFHHRHAFRCPCLDDGEQTHKLGAVVDLKTLKMTPLSDAISSNGGMGWHAREDQVNAFQMDMKRHQAVGIGRNQYLVRWNLTTGEMLSEEKFATLPSDHFILDAERDLYIFDREILNGDRTMHHILPVDEKVITYDPQNQWLLTHSQKSKEILVYSLGDVLSGLEQNRSIDIKEVGTYIPTPGGKVHVYDPKSQSLIFCAADLSYLKLVHIDTCRECVILRVKPTGAIIESDPCLHYDSVSGWIFLAIKRSNPREKGYETYIEIYDSTSGKLVKSIKAVKETMKKNKPAYFKISGMVYHHHDRLLVSKGNRSVEFWDVEVENGRHIKSVHTPPSSTITSIFTDSVNKITVNYSGKEWGTKVLSYTSL